MRYSAVVFVAYQNQQSLGVGYLSSMLFSRGFNVEIVNFGLSDKEILNEIRSIFFTRQMKTRIQRNVNPSLASNDSIICFDTVLNFKLLEVSQLATVYGGEIPATPAPDIALWR